MKTTAHGDSERFQSGADKYAAYLETPKGRLRCDLAFANLEDFFPLGAKDSLRALDLGTERIALKRSDAVQLADLFPARSFDVILCHHILEFVEDPYSVLRGVARALRDSSAILSLLVRNQAGELLKAAIQMGDLVAAEETLTTEWGQESLYGGRVRLFRSDGLEAMLKAAPLDTIAERGVRIIADYLPPQISRSEEYERIFELERKLGSRPEFAAVARYTQRLARRSRPLMEDGA
jgi:S-adenosylmethionine-dependent methyltransferase